MQTYRRFDQELKEGAVRIVAEPGKPIPRVARDGSLGDGVNGDHCIGDAGEGRPSADERCELARLRWENAELAMERDALKRSLDFWVDEAMRR